MLSESARFSLGKSNSDHRHGNCSYQNIVVRGAFEYNPHQNNKSNKSHSSIPFFTDKIGQIIQALADKSFHPVFLMHFRRMGEGAGVKGQRLQSKPDVFVLEGGHDRQRNLQTGAGNRRLDAERGQVCLQSPHDTSLMAVTALCGRRFRQVCCAAMHREDARLGLRSPFYGVAKCQ